MKLSKTSVSALALISGLGLVAAVNEVTHRDSIRPAVEGVPQLTVEGMQSCFNALQSGQGRKDSSDPFAINAVRNGVVCQRSEGVNELYDEKTDTVVFARNTVPFGGEEVLVERRTKPDGSQRITTLMNFLSQDGKTLYAVETGEPVLGFPYPKGTHAVTDRVAPEDEGIRQRMTGMVVVMQEKVFPQPSH